MSDPTTTVIHLAGGVEVGFERGYVVVMESREKVHEKLLGSSFGTFPRFTTLNGDSIWLNSSMDVGFKESGAPRPTADEVTLDTGVTSADLDVATVETLPVTPVEEPPVA